MRIVFLLALLNIGLVFGQKPTNSPTSPPTYHPNAKIYLYSNNVWDVTGYMGSRAQTKWHCENVAVTLNLFCQVHAAFVSYNETDDVTTIAQKHLGVSQTALSVVGPTGTTIANNWNSLFSTALLSSFAAAEVLSNPESLENIFYSGSNNDGTWGGDQSSCTKWTDNVAANDCVVGIGDYTETYLNWGGGNCNGDAFSAVTTKPQLVCACYYDGS